MPPRRLSERTRDEPFPLTPPERWLVAQTVVLIVFSSWAYGGAVSWAENIILGLTMLALPAVLWREGRFRLSAIGSMWPILGWLCFVAVAIANPSHEQAASGAWVPRAGWIRWLPSTVDVGRSIGEGKIWLAALVQGAALLVVLRNDRGARVIWAVAAINGFVLAAMGAIFHFDGINRFPGMAESVGSPFATFVYRNHWAAYGALTAVAGLVLAFRALPASFAGDPRGRGRALLFGGSAMLVLASLPLSGSRSGLLLGAVLLAGSGAVFFRSLLRSRGALRLHRLWIIGLTLAALGLVALGLDSYVPQGRRDFQRTVQELNRPEFPEVRLAATRDTWRMALQRPVYGWGAGTFEIVFPIFHGNYLRDENGKIYARLQFAHNDWLQLLAECGLIGGLILVLPPIVVAWRAWRTKSESARRTVGGCIIVAVYAWIDFPFHNAAVLMLWTILLTTARRSDGDGPQTPPAGHRA